MLLISGQQPSDLRGPHALLVIGCARGRNASITSAMLAPGFPAPSSLYLGTPVSSASQPIREGSAGGPFCPPFERWPLGFASRLGEGGRDHGHDAGYASMTLLTLSRQSRRPRIAINLTMAASPSWGLGCDSYRYKARAQAPGSLGTSRKARQDCRQFPSPEQSRDRNVCGCNPPQERGDFR